MTRAEIAERWAALWRRTGAPARLSRWAWAADAILALALLVGVLDGTGNREEAPSTVLGDARFQSLNGPPDGPPGPSLLIIDQHQLPLHWWNVVLAVSTA